MGWGYGQGPAPKPPGLGSQKRGSASFGTLTSPLLPLKLGRMRASYPEVRPMSLSRKSEGDMGWAELREPALISSRPETSLRGRGGRSAAARGLQAHFGLPWGCLAARAGGCACAASTPVPAQHGGSIPSAGILVAFPLTCNSLSVTCPHFACPCPTTSLGMRASVSWLQGCGGDRAQPVLEGKAGKLLLRFHLQLQLELLSKQSPSACHGLTSWQGWGSQQPSLSEGCPEHSWLLTPCQGPGRCGSRGAAKPTSTPALVMSSPTQRSE